MTFLEAYTTTGLVILGVVIALVVYKKLKRSGRARCED